MPRPITAHNLKRSLARLTREICEFGSTLAEIGVPASPQAKRHRSTVIRCIRERMRSIERLLMRDVIVDKPQK